MGYRQAYMFTFGTTSTWKVFKWLEAYLVICMRSTFKFLESTISAPRKNKQSLL